MISMKECDKLVENGICPHCRKKSLRTVKVGVYPAAFCMDCNGIISYCYIQNTTTVTRDLNHYGTIVPNEAMNTQLYCSACGEEDSNSANGHFFLST